MDTYGGLDVLVNNAGAASVGTLESQSDGDLRDAFEVNFFGVVAMSRVQTSDAARGFVGVKLGDLDGSGVQGLTGTWVR